MLVGHFVIAIIGKKGNHVLPCTSRFVVHVGYNLCNHPVSLAHTLHRQASYADIHLVAIVIRALSVIEITHVILKHIRLNGIDRVRRLIAEQVILLRAPGESNKTVIVPGIAHKQQIFRGIVGCCGTVVQHFHQTAVCRNIGSTRRELIIYLLCRYYLNGNPV